MIDLNNAEPAFALIPAGTITEAIVSLQPGNYGENKLFTKSEKTGSIGLKVCFTLTSGSYAKRKIFQLIGFQGSKKDETGKDTWGAMGQTLIRSLVESAKGIYPSDKSVESIEKRKIKLTELHNMKCIVKIGIETDKSGKHPDKNKIFTAITPDHSDYGKFKTVTSIRSNLEEDNDFNDEIPF